MCYHDVWGLCDTLEELQHCFSRKHKIRSASDNDSLNDNPIYFLSSETPDCHK